MINKFKMYPVVLLIISLTSIIISTNSAKGASINELEYYDGYDLLFENVYYNIKNVEVSGNGEYAIAMTNQKLSFYNLTSNTPEARKWDFSVTSGMYDASLSKDGKYIITSGCDSVNSHIYLFDNEKTGNIYLDSFLIGSTTEFVTDLAMSQDSEYIVAGVNKGSSSEIWYFNHSQKGILDKLYNSVIPNGLEITDIAINGNGSKTIVGGITSNISPTTYIYNSTNTVGYSPTNLIDNVTSVAMSYDGNIALTGLNNSINIINTSHSISSGVEVPFSYGVKVSITDDGNFFYGVGKQEGRCYLKSGYYSGIQQWKLNYFNITSGEISANGNYGVVGTNDNIYFFNHSNGYPGIHINNYYTAEPIVDVTISDDGSIVVACTNQKIYVFKYNPLHYYTEDGITSYSLAIIGLICLVYFTLSSRKIKSSSL